MRCVLVDPYAARNAHRLADLKTAWDIVCIAKNDPSAVVDAALAGADVAIAQGWAAPLAHHAPDLRFLHLPNAGTDAVDWAVLPDACLVANVGEHETPVAEFVMLAILESRIGLRHLDATFRRGDWSMSHRLFGPLHGEVSGATVGLVGYGRIGKAIAERARAFGMTVRAVSRTRPADHDLLAWSGDTAELETMLPHVDFLVIACPLTPATRNLIDKRRLALLPSGAIVINVARGEIVDEAALHAALAGGHLGGAALDVWWRYPDDDNPSPAPSRYPFDRMPNVIMAPHVSAWTEPMLTRRWKIIANNLDRFARGETLLNLVPRI